jgi:chaperonin GroES
MTRTQDPPAKKSPTTAGKPRAEKPKADKPKADKSKASSSRKPRAKKGGISDDVRLTGDRLIVRTPGSGERTSAGGLLIPATAMPAPKRLAWGDVTLVGPDVRVATRGDRVLFLPSSGLEVELDGEDLVLLRERDVQAVTTAGTKNERVPGQYL